MGLAFNDEAIGQDKFATKSNFKKKLFAGAGCMYDTECHIRKTVKKYFGVPYSLTS
jgi:hypothetical protein